MEERIIKDINDLLTQLFQKIKESGYEWDAEKKELRKIEQKPSIEICPHSIKSKSYLETGYPVEQNPAWSEEDEHRITDTIYFLETAKKHYASTEELHACIEWLKSLKERVLPQPKLSWSEDDEDALRVVTNIFEQYGVKLLCYPAFVHWLKTLPNRITFNPYWKPSDEQMETLENVRKILHTNKDIYSEANHLMFNFEELIRTLKKLKG